MNNTIVQICLNGPSIGNAVIKKIPQQIIDAQCTVATVIITHISKKRIAWFTVMGEECIEEGA